MSIKKPELEAMVANIIKKTKGVKPKVKSIDDVKEAAWQVSEPKQDGPLPMMYPGQEALDPRSYDTENVKSPGELRDGVPTYRPQQGNPVHSLLERFASENDLQIQVGGGDRSDKPKYKHRTERHHKQASTDIPLGKNPWLWDSQNKKFTDAGKAFIRELAKEGIRVGYDKNHLHLDTFIPKELGEKYGMMEYVAPHEATKKEIKGHKKKGEVAGMVFLESGSVPSGMKNDLITQYQEGVIEAEMAGIEGVDRPWRREQDSVKTKAGLEEKWLKERAKEIRSLDDLRRARWEANKETL